MNSNPLDEESYDEEEDPNEWIFDAIHAFFQSSRWQTPVQSFIESNCGQFMGVQDETNATPEHKKAHKQFCTLIDSLMQLLLTDIGIDQKQFLVACQGAKDNKRQWRIVKQILLVDNFEEFRKIMAKRNEDLEKKALSLMLQNEERKLKKYMKDNGLEASSSEYDSETDSENDETLQMALKLSQQQADVDDLKKGNKILKYGTPNDMEAMAMDTAGFNKLLEAHALEEEAKTNSEKKKILEEKKAKEAKEAEAKYQADLKKKNDELLNLMKKIEDDKPNEGWGFSKKNAEAGANPQDEFLLYKDNLKQAMQKLDLKDKIAGKNGEFAGVPQGATAAEVLAASGIDGGENRLQEYKDKLVEANKANREAAQGVDLDADSAPKILDMGFMGELKAAAVPDSDDECYF